MLGWGLIQEWELVQKVGANCRIYAFENILYQHGTRNYIKGKAIYDYLFMLLEPIVSILLYHECTKKELQVI